MSTFLGISGSLRSGSFNSGLLQAASKLMPADATLDIASIKAIPLYDGDLEARDGIPQPVSDLKERLAAADGVLLATPEYNNGIPGVFKNALDWLSRPPEDIPRIFGNRPIAIIGASPGGFGTILAQEAWLPVLRVLGMQPWFGARLMVARATGSFDAAGALTDEPTRRQLRDFLAGFVAFALHRA